VSNEGQTGVDKHLFANNVVFQDTLLTTSSHRRA